ncbi:hypothetical protein Pmar_PMAR013732 [Perkinsus marinus ATCC 50983]|uniref:Uncharacterized protein n=1 Tax=Perkinsus marinus (strain ATCC 50983 / TXsc) TaxID=423536 RepID=C5LY54_PERM5|nr:hypothetical protein Pmar_PMAR013732 [Perkinsus marinus ATCC 50983]EEQ98384.1 hypothetical protein Pmar_PMAR013732 [Perkinsus marinus ATCC 50983]|eukprot:XP_002765667.1 hypothetical protein Pmar_PMAR013732 [Perkinsus marinus ATCC 50983]
MSRSLGHPPNYRPASSRLMGEDRTGGLACEQIAILNQQGIRRLREGSLASCLGHLEEAESLAIIVADKSLQAATLNNKASYYRETNKPHTAMKSSITVDSV